MRYLPVLAAIALLANGADPKRPARNGMTIAEVAAAAGHAGLASILNGEAPQE